MRERERERERERVTNYLELPNNSTTFSQYCSQHFGYCKQQKNSRSSVPRIHLDYIKKDVVNSYYSLIHSLIDSYIECKDKQSFRFTKDK